METTERLIIDILSKAKFDVNDEGFFVVTNRKTLQKHFGLSDWFLDTLSIHSDWIFSQGYCIGFNERSLEEKS